MKILYPSSINWSFMHQRPQQLMKAFAKRGHECYFINKNILNRGAENWDEPVQVTENCIVLPHDTDLNTIDFDSIYYHYPPPGIKLIKKYEVENIIFDSCDLPEGCFAFWNIGGAYYKSLNKADVVVASSKLLYQRVLEYRNKEDIVFAQNACDWETFQPTAHTRPAEYEDFENIVLYTGAIASWVDFELIDKCCKKYPTYHFFMVGAEMNARLKIVNDNLHILGHLPYERMPEFIQHADVLTIPFTVSDPVIQATSPIKFYEYLASGKPILTTAIPECYTPYTMWASTDEEYLSLLAEAMHESQGLYKQELGEEISLSRIDLARKNTWDNRAKIIMEKFK